MRRLLVALLLVSGAARAQRAPLGLRTQGPLRELFLDVTSADARSIDRVELDLRYSIANTWNEPMVLVQGSHQGQQEMDEQADSLSLRVRVPWSRLAGPRFSRVSTAIEGRITLHWGGYTDAPIEGWHSLVGAFNYQRGLFPRNELHVRFGDDGATAFDLRSTTVALGDLTLRNQLTLFEGPAYGVAARFDLKLPTGPLSQAGGSGGVDAGAGLLGSLDLTSWLTLHGLVALSAFSGFSCACALQPKTWHFTGEISAAASWGSTTFLIEDRVLSPLFPPGWDRVPARGDDGLLSSGLFADFRTHNQVSFAVRRGRFSVWLSEDFTPGPNPRSTLKWLWSSNAPDLVVGLAFTQLL